jgi:hypothetical protein
MYEVIVEEFVLEVEITALDDEQPSPGGPGAHELEFTITAAATYDAKGKRHAEFGLAGIAQHYRQQIETALWVEIDSRKRRRVAA